MCFIYVTIFMLRKHWNFYLFHFQICSNLTLSSPALTLQWFLHDNSIKSKCVYELLQLSFRGKKRKKFTFMFLFRFIKLYNIALPCDSQVGPGVFFCGLYMFSLCLHGVFSEFSVFLPQSKNIHIKLPSSLLWKIYLWS